MKKLKVLTEILVFAAAALEVANKIVALLM